MYQFRAMHSLTLHVLILLLTIIRKGTSLPSHAETKQPAGLHTAREEGPHLG